MRKIVEKSMLGKAWLIDDIAGEDLMGGILKSRGIVGADSVTKFLNPKISESMPDPSAMLDMDAGVAVVLDSIKRGDKIAVFGDYDADGITATAIMLKYLRNVGCDPLWHLPTREGEGYGLNTDAIKNLYDKGSKVLITVDCGISAHAEVEYAKSMGMRVVITDHHNVEGLLPAADAVINPKRADDESGLSYLAGVGVAFMFLVALNRELKTEINLMNFIDLVAVGTICDMMPLIGLNRALVASGLKVLDLRQNLGLRTLMEISGVKKNSVYVTGFVLGPRLNAAGRINSAEPALELLMTDNILVANDLAAALNKMNAERVEIQNKIMISAEELAEKCRNSGKCSLWCIGENWHGGVMGIIAGRLKDKFDMPACVATKQDGIINGSGRSIASVDLGKIIHAALDLGILSEGGGHASAAGFTLAAENEDKFCEFLEKSVEEQLAGSTPQSEIMTDAELDASAANMGLYRELSKLEPFGQGNPEPVLVLNSGSLAFARTMGNGNHLCGNIRTSAGNTLSFVGFNLASSKVGQFLLDDANTDAKIKMLGRIHENEYNGRITVQFVLEDIAV